MPNCVRGGRGDTAHRFLLCLCPAPLNTALIQRHPNQPRVLGFALVGEPEFLVPSLALSPASPVGLLCFWRSGNRKSGGRHKEPEARQAP